MPFEMYLLMMMLFGGVLGGVLGLLFVAITRKPIWGAGLWAVSGFTAAVGIVFSRLAEAEWATNCPEKWTYGPIYMGFSVVAFFVTLLGVVLCLALPREPN